MSKDAGRVGWVDDARGIGILLVVFGHVWRGLHNAKMNVPHFQTIDSWIYAFHMPLFFLLSGLFIEHSARKPPRTFLLEKIGSLAYPYFLWTLLQWLTSRAAGAAANTPASVNDLLHSPWIPYDQFWFLYVLFVASLIALAAYQLPLGSILLMAVAIVLHVVDAGPIHWTVFYELQKYFIYFAAGALLSYTLLKRLPKLKDPALIIMAIVCFGAMTLYVQRGWRPDWLPAAFGIAGTLAVAILIDRRGWRSLKFIGSLSLQIYVAHIIFTAAARVALIKVLRIHDVPIHLIVGTFTGVAGPVALALIAKWTRFPYLFSLRLK